jgi:cation transport regulator ChaB
MRIYSLQQLARSLVNEALAATRRADNRSDDRDVTTISKAARMARRAVKARTRHGRENTYTAA